MRIRTTLSMLLAIAAIALTAPATSSAHAPCKTWANNATGQCFHTSFSYSSSGAKLYEARPGLPATTRTCSGTSYYSVCTEYFWLHGLQPGTDLCNSSYQKILFYFKRQYGQGWVSSWTPLAINCYRR